MSIIVNWFPMYAQSQEASKPLYIGMVNVQTLNKITPQHLHNISHNIYNQIIGKSFEKLKGILQCLLNIDHILSSLK